MALSGDNEFDKLLDEFLNRENDININTELKEYDPSIDEEPQTYIKSLFCYNSKLESSCTDTAKRTFYRKRECNSLNIGVKLIGFSTDCHFWNSKYRLELTQGNKLIYNCNKEFKAQVSNSCYYNIQIGEYLQLKDDSITSKYNALLDLICSEHVDCSETHFSIVDIPDLTSDSIQISDISFIKELPTEECNNVSTYTTLGANDDFNVLIKGNILLGDDYDDYHEFRINIYDSENTLMHSSINIASVLNIPEENEKAFGFYQEIKEGELYKGNHLMEVWYYDDLVLKVPFTISDNSQEGDINLYACLVDNLPKPKKNNKKNANEILNEMIGLEQLKSSIFDHLNLVRLNKKRAQLGLPTEQLPLHMVFVGNPGTGKTTVASLIGEIYCNMGILPKGHVIITERSKLVGKWLGETEQKTEAALHKAEGGVLFIDEAYNLFTNEQDGEKKDFGNRVIETLLSKLSDTSYKGIVILAGYPKEMATMLESNPGLKSRFRYTFHFEDYSYQDLLKIAQQNIKNNGYILTEHAWENLQTLIKKEYSEKDSFFGNARYIQNLIGNRIIPAMATRLAKENLLDDNNIETFITIQKEDIPISDNDIKALDGFDDELINRSLNELDDLVGLEQAKKAIHNLVDTARILLADGKNITRDISLKWNFIGNTGTGKSTVAKIMSNIFKALRLMGEGDFVEIKGEQLFNVPAYISDEILKNAMERSRSGLLFIDGDSKELKMNNGFDSHLIRIKIAAYATQMPGSNAVIIAENEKSSNQFINQLMRNGTPSVNNYILFEDYSAEELMLIFNKLLLKDSFSINKDAENFVSTFIQKLYSNNNLSLTNARTIKIIADLAKQNCLLRTKSLATNKRIITYPDILFCKGHIVDKKIGY